MPIAFALDGYAIQGLTEADGTSPAGLDDFHGHDHGGLGYHYHASMKAPYVNGGFHGDVTERDGQVHPQPRANPVRPALQPLRGARITGFARDANDSYKVTFTWQEKEGNEVRYRVKPGGTVEFEVSNAWNESWKETHARRQDR